MAYRMELPDIGEGVVEAEVQQWFVAPGDQVEEDQPLVEVMTDKATVVIPSPRRGRVVKLFWNVGDVAKVHAPLVEIDTTGEAQAAAPEGAAEPDGGERGPAGEQEDEALDEEVVHAVESARPASPAGAQKALAAPAVRALARELGVDIQRVAGTGPGGRVTKDDLAAHRGKRNGQNGAVEPEPDATSRRARLSAAPSPRPSPPAGAGGEGDLSPTATPTSTSPSPRPSPPAGAGGEGGLSPTSTSNASPLEERVPLRGVRRKIAENMARSKRTAAHFTFVEQVDVTELARVKDRIAEAARAEGVKVTFLPFVVKAVVAALRKHPKLNATMDEERGELVLHHRYDLGVASATEGGLFVPVLRAADGRSLLDLAREIARLSADTKAGRIRPEDLGRSTFTITSLGALGGLFATPVLNHPEVAILGLHRIRPTPVVRDGQVVVRDVMHLSVTSDHRVVDGHEAAAFAYEVIRTLEDPNLLFMQMV